MSTHGKNVFVPFPRYENAVFVGDSAIEALAELKIFGKALIGGGLPNMQYFHPNEKLLECTSCVMQDQRVLTTAIRRGEIEPRISTNCQVTYSVNLLLLKEHYRVLISGVMKR